MSSDGGGIPIRPPQYRARNTRALVAVLTITITCLGVMLVTAAAIADSNAKSTARAHLSGYYMTAAAAVWDAVEVTPPAATVDQTAVRTAAYAAQGGNLGGGEPDPDPAVFVLWRGYKRATDAWVRANPTAPADAYRTAAANADNAVTRYYAALHAYTTGRGGTLADRLTRYLRGGYVTG